MLNQELLEEAKAAYDSGNYAGALRGYYNCLKQQQGAFEPGEAGLVYHMLGNCLVKMRSYSDACKAYEKALLDTSYENLTAVHSNYGLALTSLGEYRKAIEQFETVLKDPTYKTPYKTYSGLGNAYMQLGDFASAGTAYRNAAVDDRNPAPVKALLNLGVCFMGLNRPADAIETYKAIFEFNPDHETLSKTYANMGQAYVAQNMMPQAVEAFENALRDQTYQLSDAAQADYLKATAATTRRDDSGIDVLGDGVSGMGYGAPAGRRETGYEEEPFASDAVYGDGIPSADDTGFFTLPDDGPDDLSVLLQQNNLKKPHRRGKVVLIIVIIILALLIAAGVLFWQGFGWPTQESVIQTMLEKNAAGEDVSDCWITVSDEEEAVKIEKIMNSVAPSTNYTIDYLDKGMMESEAIVTVALPEGGTVRYNVSLARDFSGPISWIGWKINGIEFAFPSAQDEMATASTSAGADEPMEGQADQAATDQTATDQAATGQAATDQAAAEQPAADQAATDQAATDQAAAEQPAAEQPAAEEQPAEGEAA